MSFYLLYDVKRRKIKKVSSRFIMMPERTLQKNEERLEEHHYVKEERLLPILFF